MSKCGSIHKWSDAKCIREAGHSGYCYNKASALQDGTIVRTHWVSVNGVFKSHHWYETISAKNAKKGSR